jgi:hypothetical protein
METLVPIFGMLTGILITLGFFGAIVLSIQYFTRARNKERMALIEKGVDLSDIYKNNNQPKSILKYGMFLVGAGLGIVVAYILAYALGMNEVAAYFSMILLFGGGSLILFHWKMAGSKEA